MLLMRLLFLGAGFSQPLGLPTTLDFKNNLKSDPNLAKMHIMFEILRFDDFTDLEHILAFVIQADSYCKQYQKYDLVKSMIDENSDFMGIKTIQDRLNTVRDTIDHKIQEYFEIKDENNPEFTSLYKKFFDAITYKQKKQLDVFTTNYDLVIETFCDMHKTKYREFSYFDSKNGKSTLDLNMSVINNDTLTTLVLHKLHGSLNWTETNSIVTRTSKISNKPYILPPSLGAKPIDKSPFGSFRKKLEKKLDSSTECIVIGYSFRDEDINKLFKKYIETDKKLFLISPSIQIDFAKNLYGMSADDELGYTDFTNNHDSQDHVKCIPLTFESKNIDEIINLIDGGVTPIK